MAARATGIENVAAHGLSRIESEFGIGLSAFNLASAEDEKREQADEWENRDASKRKIRAHCGDCPNP